jgi:transcriptional regulator with XRE-family HTH domain
VRVRRGWRQRDVAQAAGVSPGMVSLIERGHLDQASLHSLRRVAAVLDIRLELVARWRGGELDRLLSSRHSALADAVARWLGQFDGWAVVPEVSFAIYRERGWIDLLAWHAPTRTLLVIEIKTDIVDIHELVGTIDVKTRLAARIGRERGWHAAVIASWLVIGEGSTTRRRVADHAALLRAAFPHDGRTMRRWLRQPAGSVAALSFFSYGNGSSAKSRIKGPQRVRRSARAPDRA